MNKTNTEPKKRGRKPKGEKAISSTKEKATTEPKRRGRKPKGGKLISSIKENKTLTEIYKPNIILH